jgi:hypothetical protein
MSSRGKDLVASTRIEILPSFVGQDDRLTETAGCYQWPKGTENSVEAVVYSRIITRLRGTAIRPADRGQAGQADDDKLIPVCKTGMMHSKQNPPSRSGMTSGSNSKHGRPRAGGWWAPEYPPQYHSTGDDTTTGIRVYWHTVGCKKR